MSAIVIAILSNAGGTGKSTLCANIAYALAQKKVKKTPLSIALFDLDPQGALNLFCGNLIKSEDRSLTKVLSSDFSGNYPIKSCWKDYGVKVDLCQSDQESLLTAYEKLATHPRGAYQLADRFSDNPLPHDVVLLDCPGTLGRASLLALTAASHLLISFQPEPKSILAVGNLINHYLVQCKELRLKPYPEIMGLVPSQYRREQAIHRQTLEQLPEALTERGFGYKIYDPIRFSAEFPNASEYGIPLFIHRPGHPATQDLVPIVEDIFRLVEEKKRG